MVAAAVLHQRVFEMGRCVWHGGTGKEGTGAALHQRVGRNQPRPFAGRDRQGGGGCTGCELALLGREGQPMTGGDGCGPYQRAGKKAARAVCHWAIVSARCGPARSAVTGEDCPKKAARAVCPAGRGKLRRVRLCTNKPGGAAEAGAVQGPAGEGGRPDGGVTGR